MAPDRGVWTPGWSARDSRGYPDFINSGLVDELTD